MCLALSPEKAMPSNKIVSVDEWMGARRALLQQEKAHMRAGDTLAAARRELPWVKIEKSYSFDTECGRRGLHQLFKGNRQLIVHHLMFAPEWSAACPGCSFQAKHIDGPARHLAHHNVTILAISRAPLSRIVAYKHRMGWQFDWVSSLDSEFNYDFRVSFTDEQISRRQVDYNFGTITTEPRYVDKELPGLSVFFKDADDSIYLTYATFARGLDALIGTHHYIDLTPEGRNERAYPRWPQRHDEYAAEDEYIVR
jgi:predicted dithiol-disulfide oxidoreductase (DUF899 family)